jgi:tRNA uracil 4-sulfurtransferase
VTTPPAGPLPLYLVRLAPEVTTKSRRTRRRFQDRLVANLDDALAGLGGARAIRNKWDRIHVEAEHPGAAERIAGVFGVSSVSRVDARVPADLDRIVEVGHDLYRDLVAGHRTFAVDARRSGIHPFRSRDVAVRLGAALNPYAQVDLSRPEVTVSVEVRDQDAFLFSGRLEGSGGLPLGIEGKAVCLISGGFDSAVAAWLVLRRGVSLDYVFCNLAGDAYERMVASICKVIADDWSWGDRPRLHVVDFDAVVDDLRAKSEPRYWQIVLKRQMYRAAELVAAELGADAIVTGEAIGQVSSQTLANLRAIDAVATLPVFRPLLGFDKGWIIERAEALGTAALSARVREHCAIAPDKPVTHSSPERVAAQERTLDLALLAGAVSARKVLDLRALSAADLVEPYLFIDRVPEGAVVLDCRPAHQYRAWHHPGAELCAVHDVPTRMKALSRERTYVLYCEHGVQTAHLAELMQRVGFEAYSFRGGARRLREWGEAVRRARAEALARAEAGGERA